MVEAIIYFPLVIAVVFFLIYVGLLKLQEVVFVATVERVVQYGANEVAYPGYDVFSDDISRQVNFGWPSGYTLTEADVRDYYDESHASFFYLYHEIFGAQWVSAGELQEEFEDIARRANILSMASAAHYHVEIKRDFFGTDVIAGVSYRFDTPGIMRYLGLKPVYSYDRVAYSTAINPADFVRMVDLAVDVVVLLADKFHINIQDYWDKISQFMEKL